MASIQGIYVALFGRPADPAGLAWFNEVTNNGADLTAVADLSGTAEYQSRFEGMTNEQIVNTIYQSLFERDAEPGGLDHFVEALNNGTLDINTIAIAILDGAQGPDLLMVNAKIEAANLFTASLDTPEEIEAYVGDDAAAVARQWLDNVTPDNPGTLEDIEEIITQLPDYEPAPPPAGGGGGGGGGRPALGDFDNDTGVLTIYEDVNATVTTNGTVVFINAAGHRQLVITPNDEVEEIVIEDGAVLNVDAALAVLVASNIDEVSGDGTLNVTGVVINESTDADPAEANVELDEVYAKTSATFQVNGSETDTIKAIWDILDDRYGQAGYYDSETNAAFIELGVRYVEYLETAGSEPFTDFVAKGVGDREQSMHDNLLGNLNRASVESRNFDPAVEAELLALIPDAYEGRPVSSGDDGNGGLAGHQPNAAYFAAAAWDEMHGIARPDVNFADRIFVFDAEGNLVSSFGNLQTAITAAADGGTVLVGAGNYGRVDVDAAITIRGLEDGVNIYGIDIVGGAEAVTIENVDIAVSGGGDHNAGIYTYNGLDLAELNLVDVNISGDGATRGVLMVETGAGPDDVEVNITGGSFSNLATGVYAGVHQGNSITVNGTNFSNNGAAIGGVGDDASLSVTGGAFTANGEDVGIEGGAYLTELKLGSHIGTVNVYAGAAPTNIGGQDINERNVYLGTDAADAIEVGDDGSYVIGFDGADTIDLGAGADVVAYTAHNDSVGSSGTADIITGWSANDKIDLSAIDGSASTPGHQTLTFYGNDDDYTFGQHYGIFYNHGLDGNTTVYIGNAQRGVLIHSMSIEIVGHHELTADNFIL